MYNEFDLSHLTASRRVTNKIYKTQVGFFLCYKDVWKVAVLIW